MPDLLFNRSPKTLRHGDRQRRGRGKWTVILVAASMPFLTANAVPEMTGLTSGIEQSATVVPDAELDTMRGKYISPDAVSYFGIKLGTSWQGSDGITTFANILFNVDFLRGGSQEGAIPKLFISWSRDGDPAMDIARFGPAAQDNYVAVIGGAQIPTEGLGSVSGAVQSNIIAGSDNHVGNGMRIAIIPVDAVNRAASTGMTEITASQTHAMSDGDQIQFILEPSLIGLVLANQDEGTAIRQNVSGDMGQIAQHVLLNGSSNIVQNSADFTIGIADMPALDRIQADGALSVMKGRGF